MIFIYFLAAFCLGQLYIGFPLDEQLPTVGRVNEPYYFQIANTTYKSSNYAAVSYNASNLPSWMLFDSESRTFTGTPQELDVSQFEISLTGWDSSDGSSLTNSYQMLVSNDTGLQLSSNSVMIYQIAKFGKTNGDAGLVVKQGQNFNIQFTSDVFELMPGANRPIIAYYGRSADRSSLPNWITFNPDDLSFSGTIPYVTSDIAPSFEYGFSFLASDYYGFSGAEGLFKLIVGAHELSTSINDTIKVNGTYGESFDLSIPVLSTVYFDEELITRANISTIYGENLPDYVHLDANNYTLSGNFPSNYSVDNFTIIVQDVFQNTVQLPYSLRSLNSLFTNELADVNATTNQWFQYQLSDTDFTDINDTTVTVNYSADWLSYDKDNRTFTGFVPSDFTSVDISVDATSSYGSGSESFKIRGITLPTTSSSSSSSSSATATPSSTASSTPSTTESAAPIQSKTSNSNHKKLIIGLAVGIPLFILFLVLLLLLAFFLRKKNKKNDKAPAGGKGDSDADIEKGSGGLNPSPFGITVDETTEHSPKRLASLNALNLTDEKLDGYDDVHSTSSTMTHVDSEESKYYDAVEKTVKSWRNDDKSDMALAQANNRTSDVSMSTVNTDQLFSVRLVDDLNRNSSGSLNSVHQSESSGNIQRLDSNGDIVDSLSDTSGALPRFKRSHSQNLDVLLEETASHIHNRSDSSVKTITNANELRNDTSSTSMNLLSKVDGSQTTSKSNSHNNFLDQNSFENEFTATKTDEGEFKWLHAGNSPVISPSSETFVFNSNNNLTSTSPMKNSNLSSLSVGSTELLLNENNSKYGNKAKLVEFTRKGSLRESAYEPDYHYHEESAKIEEDSD